MIKFEVGKRYETRAIGDHDLVMIADVIARTAKTVTINRPRYGVAKFRVYEFDGAEHIRMGRYSFADIFSADRLAR